jgi:nucleotidyltransferase substrate binding protein (TIGR01987 family)
MWIDSIGHETSGRWMRFIISQTNWAQVHLYCILAQRRLKYDMSHKRFEQRRNEYLLSVAQLGRALDQPYTEFMRDSIIKRFELCFELAWKMLQAFLKSRAVEARGPKDSFALALREGLITDGDVWSEILGNRNLTIHTYYEHLATRVYEHVKAEAYPAFMRLSETITPLKWEG